MLNATEYKGASKKFETSYKNKCGVNVNSSLPIFIESMGSWGLIKLTIFILVIIALLF